MACKVQQKAWGFCSLDTSPDQSTTFSGSTNRSIAQAIQFLNTNNLRWMLSLPHSSVHILTSYLNCSLTSSHLSANSIALKERKVEQIRGKAELRYEGLQALSERIGLNLLSVVVCISIAMQATLFEHSI